MEPPSDPLDSLLDRWRNATPDPPGRLEQEVWRRAAASDANPEGRVFGFFGLIESIFARASFTAAFVAACVMLGLFLAERRISDQHAQRRAQVFQDYLRVIDPLVDVLSEDGLPEVREREP